MKRFLVAGVLVSGVLAGCDATLIDQAPLMPMETMARKKVDLEAVRAQIGTLIEERMLGPRAMLEEVEVAPQAADGTFPFTATVIVKIPTTFPGFAGGYLYKTEIHQVKGNFDPKKNELLDIKKRKIATQG